MPVGDNSRLDDEFSFVPVREENLNVMLAELLDERGLRALGEVLIQKNKRPKPDIHMLVNGVRIVIEGKKVGGWNELVQKCKERLDNNICDLCIMVEYLKLPISSLQPTQRDIKNALLKASYKIGIMSYVERVGLEKWLDLPVKREMEVYENIGFDDLLTYVMAAYDRVVKEDVLGPVIGKIEGVLNDFSRNVASYVDVNRLKDALELREAEHEDEN